jgi:rod shape-determining protein MreC
VPPSARSFSRRDTILFVACLIVGFVALQLPDHVRDPFATSLRRSVLAPLVSLQRDAELSRRAWLTREERTVARDSVLLRSMSLETVQQENVRLRKLLGLGQQLRWGFVPAEVLQGRNVGEAYTITLSAGSRAGVRPFSPIVAPEGLVGMVKSVDPTLSIAIVWAHPDFRVSAMAADGSAFGIVGAHLGNEPESYLLEMRGVPIRNTLKPGTTIVSSGLGSTFPRGIPIGTVLTEVRTSELWARTYLLRPAVLPPDVHMVMILLPERSTAGVETVWRTGHNADSAVKSIVAAGDSLARAAAAAAPHVTQADAATHGDSAAARAAAPPRDTARARSRTDTARTTRP